MQRVVIVTHHENGSTSEVPVYGNIDQAKSFTLQAVDALAATLNANLATKTERMNE